MRNLLFFCEYLGPSSPFGIKLVQLNDCKLYLSHERPPNNWFKVSVLAMPNIYILDCNSDN